MIKLILLVLLLAGCVYYPPKMKPRPASMRGMDSYEYVEVRQYNEFGQYEGKKTLTIKRRKQP